MTLQNRTFSIEPPGTLTDVGGKDKKEPLKSQYTMKRILIAALLGITGTVATAYGSGAVLFSTYYDSAAPTGGFAGLAVEWNFTGPGHQRYDPILYSDGYSAELFYGLGSNVPFSSMTGLPGSITPVGALLSGYILGPDVQIPDYVSGPITFSINVTGPIGFVPHITWTEPSIAVPPSVPGLFTFSLLQTAFPADPTGQPFIPVNLPEPGTLGLVGLGAATVLISRKRMRRW